MRNVTTRTYSATDYITLSELKTHLRVIGTDDDAYLATLLNACFDHVTTLVGYELRKSTVDYFFDEVSIFHIPARLLSITSVKYRDSTNTLQTLATNKYDATLTISADYGYDITLIQGATDLYNYGWKYKVTVVEGFAKAGDSVDVSKIFPEAIRNVIYLLAEHWYGNRSAVMVGVSVVELPLGIQNLLAPYSIKEFV